MYGRATFFSGGRQEEEGDAIREFEVVVVPAARRRQGYAGAFLMFDREHQRALALTYYADRASLDASAAATARMREEIAARRGLTVTRVAEGEMALIERAKPTARSSWVRLNLLQADLSKVDAAIDFVRTRVHPALLGQKGFRGLTAGVNRETGETIVSTIWDSREDLDASEPGAGELRGEGARIGGAPGAEVQVYEVAVVDLPVAAPPS